MTDKQWAKMVVAHDRRIIEQKTQAFYETLMKGQLIPAPLNEPFNEPVTTDHFPNDAEPIWEIHWANTCLSTYEQPAFDRAYAALVALQGIPTADIPRVVEAGKKAIERPMIVVDTSKISIDGLCAAANLGMINPDYVAALNVVQKNTATNPLTLRPAGEGE